MGVSDNRTGAQTLGRGRRAWSQVRDDVIGAAALLLADGGPAAVDFSSVSAASGVSRVTLRKHWDSPAALALDAYVASVGVDMPIRDTGDLRADLAAVMSAFVETMRDPRHRRAAAQLIGAAQLDPAMAASFSDHYFGPRRHRLVALLRLGRMRGQLRDDVEPEIVIDLLWGAMYQRILLPHLVGTLDEAAARALLDITLHGAAPTRPAVPTSTEEGQPS